MPDNPTILLAEDDSTLSILLEDLLKKNGYSIVVTNDGVTALKQFEQQTIDLCLLDIMMPALDGISLARIIRKADSHVPILFLTAKNQPESIVEGFNSGGDDYLTKPFNLDELLVRIKALLRRSYFNSQKNIEDSSYTIGKFQFEPVHLYLHCGQNSQRLTQKEAELLRVLVEHQNEIVKREKLLVEVWGDDDYFMGRSMDVFISRLRKYLKYDPDIRIINHHGVGFMLEV